MKFNYITPRTIDNGIYAHACMHVRGGHTAEL